MYQVKEKDWKQFRKMLPEWQAIVILFFRQIIGSLKSDIYQRTEITDNSLLIFEVCYAHRIEHIRVILS